MNYEKQLNEAHRQIEQLSIQVENQTSHLNMSKRKTSDTERKLKNEIHQVCECYLANMNNKNNNPKRFVLFSA